MFHYMLHYIVQKVWNKYGDYISFNIDSSIFKFAMKYLLYFMFNCW